MRKALLAVICLLTVIAFELAAAQQGSAPPTAERTHAVVMRDIASTRGRFINAVLAANKTVAIEEGAKLEGLYKELVGFYEQLKLEPGLKMAKDSLGAMTDGVAAARAGNFEGAAAAHRAISRGCRDCHPMYRQEAPDGMSYLPQWKPQYRSGQ